MDHWLHATSSRLAAVRMYRLRTAAARTYALVCRACVGAPCLAAASGRTRVELGQGTKDTCWFRPAGSSQQQTAHVGALAALVPLQR